MTEPSQVQQLQELLRETRRELGDKLAAARADNAVLRQKLQDTRQELGDKLDSVRRDKESLKQTVLETRQALQDKLDAARRESTELRRELAKYTRRTAVRDADALAHNTAESMEAWFAEVPDHEPYEVFGKALREELERRDVVLDGCRVLDAGVGPGLALRALLTGTSPAEVVGYDFSSTAVEQARRAIPSGRFEQHGIYDEPAEQFDVVICTEVLEHLEDPALALRRVVGSVAADGILVLTVPDGRLDFSAKHINFWSPESWRLFLAATLPEHDVETGVFAPRPETSYQNNLALVRPRA